MQLVIPFLGKTKQAYLAAGIDDFQQRLAPFVSVAIPTLKEKRHTAKLPVKRMLLEEGRILLGHVTPAAFVVALDSTGRELTSEELSLLFTKLEEQGRKDICFLVGGAFGQSSEVLLRANLVLSLSRLTFTHEIARFILLEQIYRAFTIKARTGYHK